MKRSGRPSSWTWSGAGGRAGSARNWLGAGRGTLRSSGYSGCIARLPEVEGYTCSMTPSRTAALAMDHHVRRSQVVCRHFPARAQIRPGHTHGRRGDSRVNRRCNRTRRGAVADSGSWTSRAPTRQRWTGPAFGNVQERDLAGEVEATLHFPEQPPFAACLHADKALATALDDGNFVEAGGAETASHGRDSRRRADGGDAAWRRPGRRPRQDRRRPVR